MYSDMVSDTLTRIRNASLAFHKSVRIFRSRFNSYILDILKLEGYIRDYSVVGEGKDSYFDINLKYYNNSSVISKIQRISKPGCRVYKKSNEMKFNVPGIYIISTSFGVMSHFEAIKKKLGGEVICYVY